MTLLNPEKRTNSFAGPLFGRNAHMVQMRRNLELLAQTDLPVVVQGESGTGKSVIAEMLHEQTETRGELVQLNCASQLQLFSDEAAHADENGSEFTLRSALRDGDTLLLDGVHELDATSQAKLLLFLKDNDAGPRSELPKLRIRVISTTSHDLQEQADAGLFRPDLLYRINAVKLVLPPLRQRPEDIPDFIAYFLKKYARETRRLPPSLSPEMLALMERYHWPGNIRQLGNVLKNYVLVGSEDVIARELIGSEKGGPPRSALEQIDLTKPIALKEITRQFTQDLERQIILRVLQTNGWNRRKTAKWLQISYRSLLYKLRDSAALERQAGEKSVA